MSKNGDNGKSVETELKVVEGGALHGAAVTMDEDLTADGGRMDAAPDAAKDGGKAGAAGKADQPRKTGPDGEIEQRTEVSPPAPAQPEHKKQLRDRIEARREELKTALSQLEAHKDTAPQEKVLAIQTALQGLDTHLGGGWDRVGEVESLQLSQWLDGTQYLGVVAAKEDDFTPPSDLKPDAAWIGATGVVEGGLVSTTTTSAVPPPARG